MTKDIERRQPSYRDADDDGWVEVLFADEGPADSRMMFRLGAWSLVSVAAVIGAFFIMQAPDKWRADPAAEAALVTQNRQLQASAKDSQAEAKRLAAAVDTLNADRDRLYARVSVLEQGLDSVTGSIAKVAQSADAVAEKLTQPQDAGNALKKGDLPSIPLAVPAKVAAPETQPLTSASAGEPPSPESKIRPTQFGVDIGGANSLEGLRALWRGALKSNKDLLGSLQPIAVMKEGGDGLGMRLRLVAGPFDDAAETAKLCASIGSVNRPCATSVYDGQRLMADAKAITEPQPALRKRGRPRTDAPVQSRPLPPPGNPG